MRCKLCMHDSSGVTKDDPYCTNCDYELEHAREQGAAEERAACVDALRDKLKWCKEDILRFPDACAVARGMRYGLETALEMIEARGAQREEGAKP